MKTFSFRALRFVNQGAYYYPGGSGMVVTSGYPSLERQWSVPLLWCKPPPPPPAAVATLNTWCVCPRRATAGQDQMGPLLVSVTS